MRLALLAVTTFALLAGCSSSGADDGSDSPSSATDLPGTGTNASVPPQPLPAEELVNETLDFASPSGGQADEASFTLPAGYGNVTVRWLVLVDCPGGFASDAPGIVLEIDGVEESLWTYAMVAPSEPYTCSPGSSLMDRVRSDAEMTLPATGDGVVRTTGQFTAEVEIVVVATA